MGSLSLLVTLHNLVNIPAAMAQCDRTFTVEAQMRDAVTTAFSAPPVSALFTSSDIIESSPHLFEVQLDKVSQSGSVNSAKVWRCTASLLEVVVVVREAPSPGASGPTRVIATSAPLTVNPREVVEWEKLATRIVGTEVGQVGVSFRVDPSDRAGYRNRLVGFLQKYNPQGLRLVDSVVEAVPETDTFAKLYKKYKLADYTKRLEAFFSVYGPNFVSQIPSLLRQWENKEMELMNHLILDNGPEMKDVDASERLAAFLSAYDLEAADPRLRELRTRTGVQTTEDWLLVLAQNYGPEPDPRTYTFPPTRYSGASESSPMGIGHRTIPPPSSSGLSDERAREAPTSVTTPVRHAASPTAGKVHSPPSEGRYLSLAMTSPLPTRPTPPQTQANDHNARDRQHIQRGGSQHDDHNDDADVGGDDDARRPEKRSATAPGVTPDNFYGDQHFGVPRQAPGRRDSSASRRDRRDEDHSRTNTAPSVDDGATAWRALCEHVLGSSEPPLREADLFYGTAEDFERRLQSLQPGLPHWQRDVLVVEWEKRARQALQVEPLLQDDPYFGSAAKEAVRLTGLQSLHLQVMTVTAVFHREHHAAFAARLDAAKERKAERLVLVGDATTLEKIARYGLKPLPVVEGGSRPPSAVFLQRPFQHWTSRHTTGVLICDVVVGHAFVNPASVTIPAEGTPSFLARYDSSVFVDKANGPAVAVYAPQQVLPRLLLHCTVDPTLAACPAHPDRPVEYYVADCDAFACSRCVVLGEYRGKDVTTIAEAAVLARARLAEVHRTALALRDSMDAFEKQLDQEAAMMANAPRRVQAEKEVERLRRETEEKVGRILAEVDRLDREQRERIQLDRTELEATRDGAVRLCETVDKTSRDSVNPLQVVSALQKVQQDRELEQLLERAESRIPGAPLEKVAPLAGLPLPPPPASSSRTVGGTAASGSLTSSSAAPRLHTGGGRSGYGLNESGMSTTAMRPTSSTRPTTSRSQREVMPSAAEAASHQYRRTPPPPTSSPADADADADADEDEALYGKYMRALAQNAQTQSPSQRQQQMPQAQVPPPSLMRSQTHPNTHSTIQDGSAIAQKATSPATADTEKEAKRALTKGWALLRQGDVDGARAAWDSVCRSFDRHTTALGAKAQAYVTEAIDKNYEEAGRWYARALEIEPGDRMTAYNYGVLLEALLEQPTEALALYDRAAALGDKVASTRAEQLRSVLQSGGDDD